MLGNSNDLFKKGIIENYTDQPAIGDFWSYHIFVLLSLQLHITKKLLTIKINVRDAIYQFL